MKIKSESTIFGISSETLNNGLKSHISHNIIFVNPESGYQYQNYWLINNEEELTALAKIENYNTIAVVGVGYTTQAIEIAGSVPNSFVVGFDTSDLDFEEFETQSNFNFSLPENCNSIATAIEKPIESANLNNFDHIIVPFMEPNIYGFNAIEHIISNANGEVIIVLDTDWWTEEEILLVEQSLISNRFIIDKFNIHSAQELKSLAYFTESDFWSDEVIVFKASKLAKSATA